MAKPVLDGIEPEVRRDFVQETFVREGMLQPAGRP
jgi:hypothetical protein